MKDVKINQHLITCSCGGGEGSHHLISFGNCFRKMATGDLIPTNFRIENGVNVCDVRGYTITEYTLLSQRLYAQHPDGQWSLPKSEDSINSIEV